MVDSAFRGRAGEIDDTHAAAPELSLQRVLTCQRCSPPIWVGDVIPAAALLSENPSLRERSMGERNDNETQSYRHAGMLTSRHGRQGAGPNLR